MAKNSRSAFKSKSKFKSIRKPLREVVNGVKIKPSATLNQPSLNKNNNTNTNNNNNNINPCLLNEEDESLDRLLLIHSDLSSLLHQIDDLVGKAIRLKATSKNDRKEIESFAHVLSEMQNSLKPWVPRFQQSISSSSLESNNQLEKSLDSNTVNVAADDDKSDVVGSPAKSNWDLLVSPSPLVSWRAGCTNEVGRQLFLLTPLPKGAISKFRGPPKPATENSKYNMNANVGQVSAPLPSHFVISEDMKNKLVEGVAANPTPYQVPDCSVICTETSMKDKFKSPEKISKIGCSMVAMTPCREVSPPKSCMLLEPISEFTHKVRGVRASTPFPTGLHKFPDSDDDPDSSSEVSGHLISKYPELVGIKLAHQFGNGRKAVEASPVWCMSPPKTCIVMEPPEDKMLDTTTSLQFPKTSCSPCGKTKKESEYQGLNDGLAVIEGTPLWKEPKSTIRTGKHPGENTLKKELWTKFEAATISGHRFGEPICQDAANKGFLDLLEEVSSGEETDSAAQLDR